VTRLFDRSRVLRLERETFEAGVQLLSREIALKWTVGAVLAIARGGREPGSLLAKSAHVPLLEMTARHNASDAPWSDTLPAVRIEAQGSLRIHPKTRVLVVDDISGSGGTLQAVTETLGFAGIQDVKTVTLCRNVGSAVTPDLWLWTVQHWVVFPWEDLPHGLPVESLRLPPAVCHRYQPEDSR
jgi:hypoxanthine phosphoribosyltransferase